MFWDRRGTHWKSLYHDDRELYELIYWEIAKAYPELDDPEDAPAAIPVVYGTRIGELTLDLIDAEAVSMFGWGYCAYLALAVHDLTGEPLVLFTSESDSKNWSGHAAVRIGEDLYLDITGTRDFASIREEYSLPEHAEPEVLSRAEFCDRVTSDEKLKENPYSYLDPIELKLLHHFAGLVNDLR